MTKDYYKILDISEFSTQEEIKTAYRHLVRKWHPDVAGNTPEVISKFKDISEAYETLSNSSKKANYDTARRFYSYAQGTATKEAKKEEPKPNFKNTTSSERKRTYQTREESKFSWEDIFKKMQKSEPKTFTPKRGEDINSDVEISIFEAINGSVKVINMLQTNICPKCRGRKFVNGAQCPHCKGRGETSTYKRFSVKIPAGIKDKSKIRLAGEGEKGLCGGANGDLYLTIHIKEPLNYKTEGLNILKTVAISPYEAVLGASVSVPTMRGSVSVKIASNTRSGQKIRLSGCGIEQNNKIGDMIVTVEIQIPKNLTNEEIELYKKLQEISSGTVRE